MRVKLFLESQRIKNEKSVNKWPCFLNIITHSTSIYVDSHQRLAYIFWKHFTNIFHSYANITRTINDKSPYKDEQETQISSLLSIWSVKCPTVTTVVELKWMHNDDKNRHSIHGESERESVKSHKWLIIAWIVWFINICLHWVKSCMNLMSSSQVDWHWWWLPTCRTPTMLSGVNTFSSLSVDMISSTNTGCIAIVEFKPFNLSTSELVKAFYLQFSHALWLS